MMEILKNFYNKKKSMNNQLQDLLEQKIRIYEKIISGIKEIDFELITEFEGEFQKIEKIDRRINSDNNMSVNKLMVFKL